MFACQECGRKFRLPKSTCPKCGGSDIDVSAETTLRNLHYQPSTGGAVQDYLRAGYKVLKTTRHSIKKGKRP